MTRGLDSKLEKALALGPPLRMSVSPITLTLTQSRLAEESADLREALWQS